MGRAATSGQSGEAARAVVAGIRRERLHRNGQTDDRTRRPGRPWTRRPRERPRTRQDGERLRPLVVPPLTLAALCEQVTRVAEFGLADHVVRVRRSALGQCRLQPSFVWVPRRRRRSRHVGTSAGPVDVATTGRPSALAGMRHDPDGAVPAFKGGAPMFDPLGACTREVPVGDCGAGSDPASSHARRPSVAATATNAHRRDMALRYPLGQSIRRGTLERSVIADPTGSLDPQPCYRRLAGPTRTKWRSTECPVHALPNAETAIRLIAARHANVSRGFQPWMTPVSGRVIVDVCVAEEIVPERAEVFPPAGTGDWMVGAAQAGQ